ncbi:MAG: L-threonylcarbamoyladenylate synthase [Parcubacteria group bacterium]|jgi:L-threonylcarbamoyladenylate synthase
MIFLEKGEILKNREFYINEIKNGKVFIYPTDTLLGLGADATNKKSVQRIFSIKNRRKKPLLVIAPSFQWIKDSCVISSSNLLMLKEKLPGPYSFILTLKNNNAIDALVNAGKDSIGIRMPDCWFTDLVCQSGVPFVTTSVNVSGQVSMLKIADIPQSMVDQVDYVVDDEASLSGVASTIIDIRGEEKVLR